MADVSVTIPPDGSPPPDQPHAQDESSIRLSLDDSPTPGNPHAQDGWFESLPRPEPSAPRPIQRFPEELRRNDEDKECYEPVAISIGPYHRQKKHLEPLQNMKALYASRYIRSKRSTFGDLYGKVERVAAEARKCYAEDATLDDMSDLDFTRMMFLDGCFILQFISGELDLKKNARAVVQDLLLLENQVPFIILKELEGPESGREYEFLIAKMAMFVKFVVWNIPEPETRSSLHFLCLRAHRLGKPLRWETHSSQRQPIHLLGFLRTYLLGNPNENMSNKGVGDERWSTFRSVKELNKAGIDFKVSTSHRFSDVRFRSRKMWRGELELPPIFIHGWTKPALLNLVAYEMCFGDMLMEIPDVTSYICFLDELIDRPEDVMELRSKGIILKNFAGSDQNVADLFNTITRNFTPHPKAYRDVKQQIEDQRKSSIKMCSLKWIDTHFEAPWSFISAVAAAIALVLTFMQTYYAARQAGNSRN